MTSSVVWQEDEIITSLENKEEDYSENENNKIKEGKIKQNAAENDSQDSASSE